MSAKCGHMIRERERELTGSSGGRSRRRRSPRGVRRRLGSCTQEKGSQVNQYCSPVDMWAAEEPGTETRERKGNAGVPAEAAAAAADEEDDAQKAYASAAEAEAVRLRVRTKDRNDGFSESVPVFEKKEQSPSSSLKAPRTHTNWPTRHRRDSCSWRSRSRRSPSPTQEW